VRHFRAVAHLSPGSAPAHFNLGTALTVAGALDEAVAEYEKALAIRPDYAQAHNNLGSVLVRRGQFAEASSHLERALRIDPSNAEAHYNAGMASLGQGRTADAIGHLKQTVQLSPDSPVPLIQLVWLLAATPDAALRDATLAVRLAERAVALTTRTNSGALDALGVAQAAASDFARAVASADAALALKPPNASEISARRELYRQGRAFRFD
jgi:Flp pilus assembly protein TadD